MSGGILSGDKKCRQVALCIIQIKWSQELSPKGHHTEGRMALISGHSHSERYERIHDKSVPVMPNACKCNCAPAWSKTCLFFCQQFLSLGLESVEEKSEHDRAGMADGTIVLTLLEVAFLC